MNMKACKNEEGAWKFFTDDGTLLFSSDDINSETAKLIVNSVNSAGSFLKAHYWASRMMGESDVYDSAFSKERMSRLKEFLDDGYWKLQKKIEVHETIGC